MVIINELQETCESQAIKLCLCVNILHTPSKLVIGRSKVQLLSGAVVWKAITYQASKVYIILPYTKNSVNIDTWMHIWHSYMKYMPGNDIMTKPHHVLVKPHHIMVKPHHIMIKPHNDKTTPRNGETAPRNGCLLYTSPSPRDQRGSRMPSSA